MDDIRGHLGDMEKAQKTGEVDLWTIPHFAFHLALRQHAGVRIARDAAILCDHAERYRRVYLSETTPWQAAAVEHAAIFDACRARDAVAAADLVVRHLARTALTVIASIAPEHDPQSVRAAIRSAVSSESAWQSVEFSAAGVSERSGKRATRMSAAS
jgi:DNA-binding GntR family transcriptional regulator